MVFHSLCSVIDLYIFSGKIVVKYIANYHFNHFKCALQCYIRFKIYFWPSKSFSLFCFKSEFFNIYDKRQIIHLDF